MKFTKLDLAASLPTKSAATFAIYRPLAVIATASLCIAVAGCASAPTGKKVKFSSAKYGVPASPKVVAEGQPVPKGGGRAVVGKPYKVAGKTYRPKRDPDYEKVGLSSWYGPTFHGRLTANGEVFDKKSLTAAHTTFPLPSYAKVTNLENGRSIVVRVNDRGPFHGNREIDVSERVATLLGYKDKGVAKVKVEYAGAARLDGQDEAFLLASYSGPGATSPGGTLPGTLFAQVTPPGGFGANAPVPQARPYGALIAVASVEIQNPQVVAFDPALAFEASAGKVQLASANGFATGTANSGEHSFAPAEPQSLPLDLIPAAYAPSQENGVLGVLPSPAPGKKYGLGGAVSSYAANTRIEAAYSAVINIDGGLSLQQTLALKTE